MFMFSIDHGSSNSSEDQSDGEEGDIQAYIHTFTILMSRVTKNWPATSGTVLCKLHSQHHLVNLVWKHHKQCENTNGH